MILALSLGTNLVRVTIYMKPNPMRITMRTDTIPAAMAPLDDPSVTCGAGLVEEPGFIRLLWTTVVSTNPDSLATGKGCDDLGSSSSFFFSAIILSSSAKDKQVCNYN